MFFLLGLTFVKNISMSIFYNVFNAYQVLINTFKDNVLKIKNENKILVDDINIQLIEHLGDEPCRSCTDFHTFSRMRRQEFSQNQVLIVQFFVLYSIMSLTNLFSF